MKRTAQPERVTPGLHFLSGNRAVAEGAIAAGCTFFAAYPITPSTDIAERIAVRLPAVGGTFIEMEDELGALAAVLGASWAGAKSMTCTSGPGYSLMMENYGLGQITETPCVIVNVQRGGPSTGLPTLVGQSDILQTRWGSHGDFEAIALAPASPQECFEMGVQAFNISERYRLPVVILSDEVVGHMTERVEVPAAEEIEVWDRLQPGDEDAGSPAYSDGTRVRAMPRAGDGTRVHVTGLTHDDRGYPAINASAQALLVERIQSKVRDQAAELADFEEVYLDDARVAVVTFGCSARSALAAVNAGRRADIRAGMLRLKTLFPLPVERLRTLAEQVDRLAVAELNTGQLSMLVEHAIGAPVTRVTSPGGRMLLPKEILDALKGA
jgi:2-oxoglutarate ferredoxin oxidoreductase subunit alpha